MDNNIIKLIQSDDYKERLQGEYLELLERVNKLDIILDKYDRGTLNFTPDTPIDILKAQSFSMKSYLYILDYRIKLVCPESWSTE